MTLPGFVIAMFLFGTAALLAVVFGTREADRPAEPDGGYAAFGRFELAKPAGLLRWITTVDHKDIGLLYLLLGGVAGLWGAMDAMMIRTELSTPGVEVWDAATYNAVFTTHGLTMLFFFVTPVFFGFANYFIPLLVGADDMAFPRINAIAFWLLPPSLFLVRAGLITEVLGKVLAAVGLRLEVLFALEPIATGWTLYTPLSLTGQFGAVNPQIDLVLLGLHLSGLATIMGAINVIVTIFVERGEQVTWANLDIFSWTLLTTSGIILFAFPAFGSALLMLLFDRNFGTAFFTAGREGPLIWQHIFWYFGHPEVYILVLPAFGLISHILPKFCGRKLFGFKFVVYSTLAIGVLSFGVWAHHMFATGIDPRLRAAFMATSLAIAVPTAVKTFNWITTMWGGRIRPEAPFLFCSGAIGMLVVGGVTGVFLASIPVDLLVHDTHYVVGHFHFIVAGVIAFAIFAASYYWFPLLTRRMYDRRLASIHAWLSIVGVPLTFFPLLVVGLAGMPRRFAEYPIEFWPMQIIASVGAFLLGISVLVWLLNVIQSFRLGPIVLDADVWRLKETGQFDREWEWFERRLTERRAGHEYPAPPGAESEPSEPSDAADRVERDDEN